MARSSNFSNEEIMVILDELLACRELVSGEFSAEIPTKKHQRDAWERIAQKVTSCGMGASRTGQQIRNKWNDLKARTRQKTASIMTHVKGTGGGPPITEGLNEVHKKVLALIGVKTITGIVGMEFDSSTPKVVNKVQIIDKSPTIPDNEDSEFYLQEFSILNPINDNLTPLPQSQEQTAAFREQIDNCTYLPDSQNYCENIEQDENATPLPPSLNLSLQSRQGSRDQIGSEPQSTPIAAWSFESSRNKSSIRGNRFRERKRRRLTEETKEFEKKAIDTQDRIADSLSAIQEAVTLRQSRDADIKALLEQMNSHLKNINDNMTMLNKKNDTIIKLLSISDDISEDV